MSAYFDDQPDDISDAPAPDESAAPQPEGQAPLLLQDMQTPEEMFAMAKPSQRPRQAVIGAILVVGAVGAIFAMRQFGLGPAVSLAEMDLDYKPADSSTGLSPKQVLDDLERSRRAVQVPADQITQDPFELSIARPVEDEPEVDTDLAQRAELDRLRKASEKRERELDDAFAKLKLQGVMGGSVPMARINKQIFKVGMTVAEHFAVSAIKGREVTLTADDREFVLTMDKNN